MNDRITIEGPDGAFGAYIERPKVLPAPAVVVLHEVFGVNADIRKTCHELAQRSVIAGWTFFSRSLEVRGVVRGRCRSRVGCVHGRLSSSMGSQGPRGRGQPPILEVQAKLVRDRDRIQDDSSRCSTCNV